MNKDEFYLMNMYALFTNYVGAGSETAVEANETVQKCVKLLKEQAANAETSDNIVHCKDCKYFRERDYEFCDADGMCFCWNGYATVKDGFCFKGKVKVEE